MQLPTYSQNTSNFAQPQHDNSYYNYTTHPPNLPPEIDRAIERGSYTKRMSLMVDRVIVAAELRFELEFGGDHHG